MQPVYASMNRPLTIGGAERRLFLLALILGSATFTFFDSLFAGLLMFLALYLAARGITQADPQLLRIVLRSSKSRARYDPGTLEYVRVGICRKRGEGPALGKRGAGPAKNRSGEER
jgi:type IV secretory pathway TrbD component